MPLVVGGNWKPLQANEWEHRWLPHEGVSGRTTNICMWPKHVCMKGLCNVLNNEFTTVMWHLPNKTANPHGGSQMVVYCEPPATPQMHTPTHTVNPPQL